MKKNIAVIEGGYSNERAISIKSAQIVFENIDRDEYNVYKISIDENGWFGYDVNNNSYEINRSDFSYTVEGNKINFDCAFIVIHGTPGEDGKLQAYFDMLNIPYTTASHLAATVLLLIGYFSLNYIEGFANNDSVNYKKHYIEVPNFKGVHVDDLKEFMSNKDLRYVVSDSVYSDDAPAGTVLRQDPIPHFDELDSYAKPGRTIYLTIVKKGGRI